MIYENDVTIYNVPQSYDPIPRLIVFTKGFVTYARDMNFFSCLFENCFNHYTNGTVRTSVRINKLPK